MRPPRADQREASSELITELQVGALAMRTCAQSPGHAHRALAMRTHNKLLCVAIAHTYLYTRLDTSRSVL